MPTSFIEHPLTPPPTNKKPFLQAERVIALQKDIRAGRHIKHGPWAKFLLSRDEALLGYVKDKIRSVSSRNDPASLWGRREGKFPNGEVWGGVGWPIRLLKTMSGGP